MATPTKNSPTLKERLATYGMAVATVLITVVVFKVTNGWIAGFAGLILLAAQASGERSK